MRGYICDSCNRPITDGNERYYTIGIDDEYTDGRIYIGGCRTERKELHFCNKQCMIVYIDTCIAKSMPKSSPNNG